MRRSPRTLAGGVLGGATLVALVAIGIASAGQASAVFRLSTFDSSSQGWSGIWHAKGGNPGGHVTGAIFGSSGSWRGNVLGAFRGTLKFDLAAPSADKAVVRFVTLNSSAEYLCREFSAPAAAWTTYSITLDRNGLRECDTGTRLTPVQLTATLAGLDHITVFVFGHAEGADDSGLDNPSISGPDSAVTAPTGTVARVVLMALYRGNRLRGGLIAPDDYSCAGSTKITIFRRAKRLVRVATATTREPELGSALGRASFSVRLRRLSKGSYYASVRTKKSPLDGNTCLAARSKSIRVR